MTVMSCKTHNKGRQNYPQKARAFTTGVDEDFFISKCLEKDDFSIPVEEIKEIKEIKNSDMLENIQCIFDDLEKSEMKSNIISKIKNIVSVGDLPHNLASAGGSFFVVCVKNIFYINLQRES